MDITSGNNAFRLFSAVLSIVLIIQSPACTPGSPQSGPRPIILENVTVIDGTGREPAVGQRVVLEGERITYVGPAAGSGTPAGAEIIDLSGKFVIPGFVDLHVHLPEDVQIQDKILKRLLEFGVTTILNPGARSGAGVELQERIRKGLVRGPNMLTAGRIIDHYPSGDGLENWAALVTTEKEIREEVRKQAATGVQFIKLYKRLPAALVAAGIDEAHKNGLKVIGHMGETNWGEAARNGIDMIVHSGWGTPMDEIVNLDDIEHASNAEWYKGYANATAGQRFRSLVRDLKENDVMVVPTLSITQVSGLGSDSSMLPRFRVELAPEAGLKGWWSDGWRERHPQYDPTDAEEEKLLKTIYFPAVLGITKAYYEYGVPMGVGTDVGNSWMTPGVVYHYELGLYQEAGIPPLAILKMATRDGAEFLGVLSDRGTIEPGKRADLIVLDADPAQDIRNTTRIESVYLAGKPVTGRNGQGAR